MIVGDFSVCDCGETKYHRENLRWWVRFRGAWHFWGKLPERFPECVSERFGVSGSSEIDSDDDDLLRGEIVPGSLRARIQQGDFAGGAGTRAGAKAAIEAYETARARSYWAEYAEFEKQIHREYPGLWERDKKEYNRLLSEACQGAKTPPPGFHRNGGGS